MTDYYPDPTDLPEVQQLQIARWGDQVRREIHNPVIMQILKMAADAADLAIAGLADADADDAKQIRRLQNEFRRNRDMLTWIKMAIDNGDAAEKAIMQPVED